MGHWDVRAPSCLVDPVSVLRETGKVYDAEIRAACRPSVWSRFSDVVESCPYELSADEIIVAYELEGLLVGASPWNTAVLI